MKVLFVCSGGMSSAIVVNALKKKRRRKKGMNMEVHAIGTNEVEEEVKEWLGRCNGCTSS